MTPPEDTVRQIAIRRSTLVIQVRSSHLDVLDQLNQDAHRNTLGTAAASVNAEGSDITHTSAQHHQESSIALRKTAATGDARSIITDLRHRFLQLQMDSILLAIFLRGRQPK